ncbi:MAG: hypothetical protein KF708_00610 [Pirellulales bacterium]|nr:hypothetical protein [Pirellulales bacterium]
MVLATLAICTFSGTVRAQGGPALVSDAMYAQWLTGTPVVYGSDTAVRWTTRWDPMRGLVAVPARVPDDQNRQLKLAGQPSPVGMTDRLTPPTILELNRSLRQQDWPAIQPEGVNMTKHLTQPTVLQLNRRLREQARRAALPVERHPSPGEASLDGTSAAPPVAPQASYGVRQSRTR